MIETVIALLILWIAFSILFEIAIMEKHNGSSLFTPKCFYKKGMNWFGAYATTILIGIVSPFMLIFKIVKWLFTVGRK